MNADRKIGFGPYALGLLVIAVSVSVALLLAYWQGLGALEEQAQRLADEMLFRSHAVSEQFDNTALKALLAQPDLQPCSDAGVEEMRRLAINSRALRVIGYIQNDRLLCSSYGSHGDGIPMGPPSFVSKNGFAIRSAVPLAFAGDSLFLTTTHQNSGYTAFVLPGLVNDIMPGSPNAAFGLFGASSQKPLMGRGDLKLPAAWMSTPLNAAGVATFHGDGHLVVLRRSPRFGYVAYAALPLSNAVPEFRSNSLILVPLALVAGLALAALIVLQAKRRQALPNLLRQALRRDELFLAYQPFVDLETGRWIGAEALARWRTASGEMIPPDVFIAVAESEGMIREVTAKVIALFARDAGELLRRHPEFRFSINFSSQDLTDGESVEALKACIQTLGIAPARISVEITERALIHADAVRRNIKTLREAGTRIAIDDFGTGYSGLSYLATLELDALKIDKVFIDTIGTDAVTNSVVSHIIEIAKSMGLRMVAEGVETQEQADYLRARGVQCAQGWLYAKAMPMGELLAGLDAHTATPVPAVGGARLIPG
ncbi:MAG: EAL domain-containing protein [Betaproteobacteria bacterium]|nr:EAL domain-containing protein [Betaproteobacteria bacterium]